MKMDEKESMLETHMKIVKDVHLANLDKIISSNGVSSFTVLNSERRLIGRLVNETALLFAVFFKFFLLCTVDSWRVFQFLKSSFQLSRQTVTKRKKQKL